MKPKSIRALAGFSAILVITGAMVMSPSAGFALMVLAGLCAIVPAAVGSRLTRIGGIVLLIVSILFAASFYPHFTSEQDRIHERAKNPPRALDPGDKR